MTQPDIFDDGAPWAERLPELRLLLEAYASVPPDERFTDSPAAPSKAMRAYLRMATYYPGRAFRATAELLDTLKRGFDDPEVAAELATMPPIVVPEGRTRQDCLTMMVPHLVMFTEAGEKTEPATPETCWEWRERFPNLATLLGGHFHEDAGDEFAGPDGSVDDEAILAAYAAGGQGYEVAAAVAEIRALLEMTTEERELETATTALGAGQLPPPGLSYEGWLRAMADYLARRLEASDYQRPDGPDPAYPPHDKRAYVR